MDKNKYVSYEQLIAIIAERCVWNQGIIEMASKELKKTPEGQLVVTKSHNKTQYFQMNDSSFPNNRTYLNRSNKLIPQLASKKYNQKILKIATQEKQWLDKILKSVPKRTIEDVFADRPELRILIEPYYMTDEEFVNYWRSKTYESNSLFREKAIFLTENNEMVRSKSEKIIADKLLKLNIPYKYECPLPLNGKVVYPDFRLLNVARRKEIIHEHFGMMDNPEYVQRTITKINEYARNGILIGDRLIATFETTDGGLDIKAYEKMLEKYVLQ